MMKKRKCEQPEASSSLVSEDSAPEDEKREQSLTPTSDDATDDVTLTNEHQQKKRKVSTLNFSIESIMSSSSPSADTLVASRAGSRAGSNSPRNINMKTTRLCPASFSSCDSPSHLSGVECQLDNKDMWDKFHSLNTEMIITKTGRRMFPVMKVQFLNLDPSARYAVSMDIVPVDNKRYRYAYHKSCWQVAGKADPSAEPRLYPHPDSPFNGDLLSRQVISFEKVKLTNNEMDKSGHIILNSMHKYQPRVHLIELHHHQQKSSSASGALEAANLHHHHHHQHHHQHHQHQHQHQHLTHNHQQPQQQHQQQLAIKGYRTFVFPETIFTAVTAYQNQLITKMKIEKNPFAKGFRDSSRLSDLDRNDPFDRLGQSGTLAGMDAGAAGAAQLLASTAANPWYSAAANPFNPMYATHAAQLWLAAFSELLNGGAGSSGHGPGSSPTTP